MLCVFFTLRFLCLVRRLASFFFFRSSLLRVAVLKIFGSELLFLGVGVGRVFFGAVLPLVFALLVGFSPRKCLRKILLMSGLVFLGVFLSSFGFSPTSLLFFKER